MAGAIHFYLQLTVQNTKVQIVPLAGPLSGQRRYSLRCISQPNIVAHLYWGPSLPDRRTRDQMLVHLESFIKDVIAADDQLYRQVAAQLDGEDWSFVERHSIH